MWHQPRAEFWRVTFAQFMSLVDEHHRANPPADGASSSAQPSDPFSLDRVPMGSIGDLQKVSDLHP